MLAATSVPTSIGGWGLREGVAAAVFAAAGLGAASGVATAVVYGVMVTVSTLPGLLVVAAGACDADGPRCTAWLHRCRRQGDGGG